MLYYCYLASNYIQSCRVSLNRLTTFSLAQERLLIEFDSVFFSTQPAIRSRLRNLFLPCLIYCRVYYHLRQHVYTTSCSYKRSSATDDPIFLAATVVYMTADVIGHLGGGLRLRDMLLFRYFLTEPCRNAIKQQERCIISPQRDVVDRRLMLQLWCARQPVLPISNARIAV